MPKTESAEGARIAGWYLGYEAGTVESLPHRKEDVVKNADGTFTVTYRFKVDKLDPSIDIFAEWNLK